MYHLSHRRVYQAIERVNIRNRRSHTFKFIITRLAVYRGYLRVDAAPAYDEVFAQYPGIVEVGCMAHARRYFKEALPTAAVPCAQALAIVGPLYRIEWAASDRHLDAPARQRLRQEQALPILETLQAYLREQRVAALPKSPLGAAIG
jgi:transposase